MELKLVKSVGEKTLYDLNLNDVYTTKDLIYRFPKDYIVYEPDYDNAINGLHNVYLIGTVDSRLSMFKFRGKTFCFSFYLKCNDTLRIKMNLFSTIYVGVKVKQGMRIGVYGKYNLHEKYFSIKKLFTEDLGFKIENNYKLKVLKDSTYQRIVSNYFKIGKQEPESLPQELLDKYKLLGINEYLYKSHFPLNLDDLKQVLRRRKYEEFYWYSISFDLIRSKRIKAIKEKRNLDLSYFEDIKGKLSYELTNDQNQAVLDIIGDLKNSNPMNRIIQGDVGSGKTIISIISALLMVKAGYQVAVMAPTEILAEQHYESFKKLLLNYDVNVSLLTSSMKSKEKNEIEMKLSENRINVIIGTHSLIYDKIIFSRLGLVIIDEQHRFGVNQRLKLINKYDNVDSLFLSATPIPRTLGLTIFKDLDISSIKELPGGRKPIVTKILGYDKIELLMKSIKNHVAMGEQAFVVCPLVLENEDLDLIDVEEAKEIFSKYLPDLSLGIIHGKMKAKEKDEIIFKFRRNEINVLISTTVIEVGINIPNATMMIILDAERFGLSTLHQLRGRVGRGDKESFCILVSKKPDTDRLLAMEMYKDGFNISEMDFKLRGPGDYLGESQSGFFGLEYASFENDLEILKCAKNDSQIYLSRYMSGELKSYKYDEILERSKKEIDKIN